MTDVARYSDRDIVDGWVPILAQTRDLAGLIAATEFVPKALAGKPAAVAAVILTGREMGLGPMSSLRHLFVVDGRPSMSAELMRSLILANGHELRIDESTQTSCTLSGRRAGSDVWTSYTWTLEDARRVGLDRKTPWRNYPRAMLLARVTGELGRAVFPDALAGVSLTVEEARDIDAEGEQPSEAPEAPRARPVARARKPKAAAALEPAPLDEPLQGVIVEPTSGRGEPQSGPGGPDQPVRPDPRPEPPAQRPAESMTETPGPLDEQPAASELDEPLAQPVDGQTTTGRNDNPASRDQQAHIYALLEQLGAKEPRARRIEIVQSLIARRIDSMARLTVTEASVLIDSLAQCIASNDPPAYLSWIVNAGLDHLALMETGEPTADADVLAGPWDGDGQAAEPEGHEEPGFD